MVVGVVVVVVGVVVVVVGVVVVGVVAVDAELPDVAVVARDVVEVVDGVVVVDVVVDDAWVDVWPATVTATATQPTVAAVPSATVARRMRTSASSRERPSGLR